MTQKDLFFEDLLKMESNEEHGKRPPKEKYDDHNTPSGPSGGKGEKTIKTGMSDPKGRWFRKGEHKNVFAYAVQNECDKNGWIIGYSIHPGQVSSGWLYIAPPVRNLRTDVVGRALFLQLEDGLLAEQDQELPFSRHVVCAFQHIDFIEYLIMVVLMRAQEVVVGDPECCVIVCTIIIIVTAADPVSGFKGSVEAFDHLLVRAELPGDSIIVCKSDHLGDVKPEAFPRFLCKLQGSQRIGAVPIGNEPELFREFLHAPERHAHGKDARTDRAVVGNLVAEDRAGGSVHDEPDVAFDTVDFDIGLIGGEDG